MHELSARLDEVFREIDRLQGLADAAADIGADFPARLDEELSRLIDEAADLMDEMEYNGEAYPED